jgi:SAP domain
MEIFTFFYFLLKNNMVAFEDMTVVQLKERLTARGLPKTGNKAELIARLRTKKSPVKKVAETKVKSPVKKTFAGVRGAHKSMKSAATSRKTQTKVKKTFAGERGAHKSMKSAKN